ncbi:MAG: GMP/IMP nucleotidase [Gammaproteobacteria bacterium]|nr:GMP/IMP nucleotidase [Gammaproteobacteria bacterium]MCP4091632.1 GMP/IMP nucleotidase [Gammaproteobacteria bacterium]MCP4276128.1 GMP/IMP nucleotidase [Gammaproteobacteria bacterium]MCP4830872.1 GMP/IMP nucleotidase [Gammaproteobacteria bacterium]MCP4929698.1 GMP/IMP nucleotidase [Gammaproteobacteria bacterium]
MNKNFQKQLSTINWVHYDTILLDMDGTVLDLAFDNYFWRELVPGVYAEQHDITEDAACQHIYDLYSGREGTLEWYCLEFWTEQLGLDLLALKKSSHDRIRFLPGARTFLDAVKAGNKRLVLVTNAHQHALDLKKAVTGLDQWFDEFVCSHDFGVPKEHPDFWCQLQEKLQFDPATTLFVDDSIPVLDAAVEYGLAAVVAIRKPDTRMPPKDTEGHYFIDGVGWWI